MITRIGLLLGSIAAVLGLAATLALAGLVPHPQDAIAAASPTPLVQAAAASEPPRVQVDTVYLLTPKAETVVVHKPAPAASQGENDDAGEIDDGD